MVEDIPASTVLIAADVLDAIDPDLDEDLREDAALRAVDTDPIAAVGMLTTLLRETYELLAQHTGEPVGAPVRRLRQRFGARFLDSSQ